MTWADVDHRWPGRMAEVARRIPPGSRVLDLGAGAEGLRELLPPDCTYTPADQRRRSPDTLLVGLDDGPWPQGRWDIAVVVGVLEYARHPEAVLRRLRYRASQALVTYAHAGRRDPAWRNSLSEAGLRKAARRTGWRAELVGSWSTPEIAPQLIWLLQ